MTPSGREERAAGQERSTPRSMVDLNSLSISVPAYNEEGSLEIVVQEALDVLEDLGLPYELIIVDDGSTDRTAEIADRLACENPCVRAIHHEGNKGAGAAFKTGLLASQNNLISSIPADGEFPAEVLKDFIVEIADADLVLGYVPQRVDSTIGRMLSALERMFLHLLVGSFPDCQGLLMIRKELLDKIRIRSASTSMVTQELIIRAYRRGCRMKRMPTPVRPRLCGESKVNNLPTILRSSWELVKLSATISFADRNDVAR